MSSATRILTPLRIAFLALLEAGFMVVSAFALPAHALWNGSAPVGADTITTGSSKAEDEADATPTPAPTETARREGMTQ